MDYACRMRGQESLRARKNLEPLSVGSPVGTQLVSSRTKRRRPHMPRPPVLSSSEAPWKGIRVEHFKGGPAEADDEAPLWHHVLVQLDEPSSFEWREGDRTGRTYVPPWNVGIYPALRSLNVRNRDTRDFICLSIEPEFLRRAAHDISQIDQLELAFRPVNDDPLVRGLALALKSELEAGCPGGRWYGESLASALAVHLVRRYSTAANHGHVSSGANDHAGANGDGPGSSTGLGRNRLREAVEFMHNHLAEDLRLEQIAQTTGLSPYHFARLFKRSTGLAPHQYLIRRRVDRARELLLSTNLEIADIATQAGFCDQSHLTTHFKRIYGVTPRVFIQEFARRKKQV